MADSVVARYGRARLAQIVAAFYRAVLRSPRLGPYFENVSIRDLIDHQTAFLVAVSGGPPSYSDEHLRDVHAPLAISEVEYDEMIDLLRETLQRFEVEPQDVSLIMDGYLRLRPEIVGAEEEGVARED